MLLAHAYQPDGIVSPFFSLPFHQAAHYVERLAVYGIGAAIMIVALQHGELSVLYPLISLNYVWVAIIAVLLFNESMNPEKVAGIVVIMAGVAILGKGAHR